MTQFSIATTIVSAAITIGAPLYSQTVTTGLRADWGTVLVGDSGSRVLKQCSRDTPETSVASWVPDSAMISALEERLPAAFEDAIGRAVTMLQTGPRASAFKGGPSKPIELRNYHRQYVPIAIDGRRFIYINGFDHRNLDLLRQADSIQHRDRPEPFDWRNRPVIVCDGGLWLFGATFDVTHQSFSNFGFNPFP